MNAVTKHPAQTAIHKSIAAALSAAQAEMGPALKDANNPHFKTKYADLSSVSAACMPALNAHGIAVIQPPYDDETGRYVKTILLHGETGETLECRVPLIVQKNDMQGYGSAVTYARRYGLMAMAGIAPEDDDGNAAVKAAPIADVVDRHADAPKFDAAAAAARIKATLLKQPTVADLKDAWESTKEARREVHDHDPAMHDEIKAVLASRKADLEATPSEIIPDEIPF